MSDTLTLAIAILGLVLSVAGLVWQAVTFRLEGPRASCELRTGLRGRDGYLTSVIEPGWWTNLAGMQDEAYRIPIVALTIRNTGRAPTTVSRYYVKTDNGIQFGLTGAPPGTDKLPHRLESDSSVLYYLDLLDVAAMCHAAEFKTVAGKVTAVVELGSGRVIRSKEQLDSRDLIALLPVLQAAPH